MSVCVQVSRSESFRRIPPVRRLLYRVCVKRRVLQLSGSVDISVSHHYGIVFWVFIDFCGVMSRDRIVSLSESKGSCTSIFCVSKVNACAVIGTFRIQLSRREEMAR